MQHLNSAEQQGASAPAKPYQVIPRHKPEDAEHAQSESPLSDDTKRKVDAAKSYIENMYKNQQQNIQERYARYVNLGTAKEPY